MAEKSHGSVEQLTGYQSVGPNHIVGGPPAPGSYQSTPDRTLVRMTDPRIEDPMIPGKDLGPGRSPGGPQLAAATLGSGRM